MDLISALANARRSGMRWICIPGTPGGQWWASAAGQFGMKRPRRRVGKPALLFMWRHKPSRGAPGRCPGLACVAPLPRAGVCRAVAPGWRMSRRWRSRVMAGLAALGPSRGSVGGWRLHALFGVLRQRRRDVFPHASASLRLGGRFIFSRFMRPEMPWERVGENFQVHEAESPAEARRRGGFGFRMSHDAIGPAVRRSLGMSP